MTKKLYRNKSQSILGGVAAGIAEYFDLDTTLVRVGCLLAFFLGGSGLLIYIILWIVLPEKQELMANGQLINDNPYLVNDSNQMKTKKKEEEGYIGGAVLILIGSIFLINNFVPGLRIEKLWPIILIVIGILLLFGVAKKKNNKETDYRTNNSDIPPYQNTGTKKSEFSDENENPTGQNYDSTKPE